MLFVGFDQRWKSAWFMGFDRAVEIEWVMTRLVWWWCGDW